MYITDEIVKEVEARYGAPDEVTLAYEMRRAEYDTVRRSQKHGRAHDVTFFIVTNNRVVVIKKPMYPEGAYRAPSGGINPGESFEGGLLREAYEETGLSISIDSYLLRARVRFSCGPDVINWTTHVFSAHPVGGSLRPIDTHEIVEARLASVEDLRGGIKDALTASGSTGLRYRSDLSDMVVNKLLAEQILIDNPGGGPA